MSNSTSVMTSLVAPRKRYIAAALVALLAAAVIGLAHWLLSEDVLAKDVAFQIRRTTGFATTIDGPVRLRLFPQPRIEIQKIGFSDASGAVRINAAALSAYLRLLPLLVGRVEIGRATLYRPDITIALDRRPMTADSDIGHAAMAKPASPEAAHAPMLGRIDIIGGHARFDTGRAQNIPIDDINLSINWPSINTSAALEGQMTLRGTPVGVQAWLSQPIDVLRGAQSATTLRLQSEVLTLWTSGRIAAAPRLQYAGRLFASAPSLRRLAEVAGHPFPRHGTFADFELQCDVDFKTDETELTNLHLALDGNDYEGNLAVEDDGGLPRFSGTLASDLLDATPFLAGVPTPSSADGLWNHETLDLADLTFADLDLRLSASRLRLYDMEIDDAALSFMTKPGLIDLALAEATANNGTIKGRVSLAAKDQKLELHVIGSGKGIDMRPMAFGRDSKRPLSGSLDASLAVDSTGADFDLLMQGLAGHAEIAAADGAFDGVDLVTTLQHGGPKTAGEPIDAVAGTTAFDRLNLGLRIANGIAEIAQGQLVAPDMRLNFAGNADIGHRTLDLSALAETAATSDQQKIAPTPFELKGGWDNLQLLQGRSDLRLPPPPRRSGDLPDTTISTAPAPE